PAVKDVAATVEDDLANPGGLGALGDQLPDRGRRGAVGAGFDVLLQIGVERRRRRERASRRVIDHLRVDVPRRAKHRQPRPQPACLAQLVAHPLLAAREEFCWFVRHGGYFFLPSLRRITSSEYLMPLPLYGSGPR